MTVDDPCGSIKKLLKKDKNSCGLSEQVIDKFEKYLLFVIELCEKYDLDKHSVYKNAKMEDVEPILNLKLDNNLHEMVMWNIAELLKKETPITLQLTKSFLGILPLHKKSRKPKKILKKADIRNEKILGIISNLPQNITSDIITIKDTQKFGDTYDTIIVIMTEGIKIINQREGIPSKEIIARTIKRGDKK